MILNETNKENIYINPDSKLKIEKEINIIHFNDVYNIEPRDVEPVGGVSRFRTLVEKLISQEPKSTIVLFSGDAFNPSTCKLNYLAV